MPGPPEKYDRAAEALLQLIAAEWLMRRSSRMANRNIVESSI
jgi:hypothetical protein